jgi:hypothetical protein
LRNLESKQLVKLLNLHCFCSCVHFVVKQFMVSSESTLYMGISKNDVCLLNPKCSGEGQ